MLVTPPSAGLFFSGASSPCFGSVIAPVTASLMGISTLISCENRLQTKGCDDSKIERVVGDTLSQINGCRSPVFDIYESHVHDDALTRRYAKHHRVIDHDDNRLIVQRWAA
jgi:hypothetical protein